MRSDSHPTERTTFHGSSNRLVRLIFSRHVRDLHTIAISAMMLSTVVIAIWFYLFSYSSFHTKLLDDSLNKYYSASACLSEQSWIGSKKRDRIFQVEAGLAKARRQLPFVDGYLWSYIYQPQGVLPNLNSATARVEQDLMSKSTESPEGKCVGLIPAPPSAAVSTLDSDLQVLLTTATHLTSAFGAVSAAQGFLPILAVFAAFGTAVVAFGGWLYRTADSRLSVVDLIAAEIFSVCRAAVINKSIEKLRLAYNTSDLGLFGFLEIDEKYNESINSIGANFGFFNQSTIIRVTGYYASLKIFLDRVRMLKSWAIDIENNHRLASSQSGMNLLHLSPRETEIMQNILAQVIYDLFICLENARISLHYLLEGGRLHDQSIFLCLLSEIRAFAFLRARYADVEYIRARLEDRSGRATEISDDEWYDEFERYSHPEFQNAITKLRKNYERFYGKGQGSEVVDILGDVPSPIVTERGEALAKREAVV
jgi:hypothetical protein